MAGCGVGDAVGVTRWGCNAERLEILISSFDLNAQRTVLYFAYSLDTRASKREGIGDVVWV